MEYSFKELREMIAASLYIKPCTETELNTRDFLKNISAYLVGMQLQRLDKLGATYYRGEVIGIYKKWAKDNLKDYELF